MSDSKTRSRFPKVNTAAPRVETGPVKPAATAPKNADKTVNRHAAISNKLNTWRSYKHWVEKIRTTWDEKP
jgi:hypothetical protein